MPRRRSTIASRRFLDALATDDPYQLEPLQVSSEGFCQAGAKPIGTPVVGNVLEVQHSEHRRRLHYTQLRRCAANNLAQSPGKFCRTLRALFRVRGYGAHDKAIK